MSLLASPLTARSGYVYDANKLVEEATNSVFAIRNQVPPRGVRALWGGLCNYIAMCLKAHKVRWGQSGRGWAAWLVS